MHQPRLLFDELMSPFIFLPLLEFSFEGGAHTRQGAEFFKLFFYNLFIAEPNEAALDVLETNFSFLCSQQGPSLGQTDLADNSEKDINYRP